MNTNSDVVDPEQIDITADLDDSNAPVNGSEDASSLPDGSVKVEHVSSDTKPANSTLRDQLSSAFKGENSDNTQQDTKPVTDIKLTQDAEGRWRRGDGTFASAGEVEAFSKTTTDATQGVNVNEVISRLPAAIAEEFKSLPAKTQDFLARTMEGLDSRAQRYSEYDQLESIIGPRRDAWAANGMNSVVAVNQLFALSDFASTNPGDFVLWFAENNGIDLDALLDARDAQQAQVDPQVAQLQGQVQQLNQQLQQLTGGSQPQVQQHSQHIDIVRNFATEKGEDGSLLRPYFADVTDTLPAQITAIMTSNPNMPPNQVLAQAYQNACWASPTVREKMQAEIEKQRQVAAKQKAEAARLAGSSIRGGPSGEGAGNSRDTSGMSIRELLKQEFQAQRS